MKNVLAICGSLREKSVNLTILEIIAEKFGARLNIEFYRNLARLPHFNPDDDAENPPEQVKIWREKLKTADGVLICTPEYVFSPPAALKNALEWTVSTADFYQKTTALITASTSGATAHESLFLILKTLDAAIDESSALLISHPKTKIKNGEISDAETAEKLHLTIEYFLRSMS